MSESFTQEEIQFFIENAGKFGEWEPREGDWVFYLGGHSTREPGIELLDSYKAFMLREYKTAQLDATANKRFYTPLFTLGQLLKMLEEEGVLWRCGHIDPLYKKGWLEQGLIKEEDEYFASKRPEIGDERRIVCYGPTPIIAVGKALLQIRASDRLGEAER